MNKELVRALSRRMQRAVFLAFALSCCAVAAGRAQVACVVPVRGVATGSVYGIRELPAGDVLIGLPSPGLRSNGYSLARRVLFETAGLGIDDELFPGHTVGDELLRPSVIYARALLGLREAVEVHAFAHVTGGGIAGNLVRVLPPGVDAVVRRGSWPQPRIFAEVAAAGDVAPDEMARVFNLGIGMIAVVAADAADAAIESLARSGHDLQRHGLEPGPRFKHLLDAVREAQLEGIVTTPRQALELVERLVAEGQASGDTK